MARNNLQPTIYFRLTSIDAMPMNELKDFYVVSSGNSVEKTLLHSTAPFLLVSYGKEEIILKKANGIVKEEVHHITDRDGCVYKKDGICSLKGFVNFQYICERPTTCARQKK